VSPPYYASPAFWLLLGLWPPILAAILLVRRYRRSLLTDAEKLRYASRPGQPTR